ncbi:MAG: hypothetical protein DHS20C11_32610 [Lysobacteraceae bacterium]|nr:MAG: hypothetical protein DHS20C11_32610 [Xanthomonadaceae bacterium]
MFSKRKRYIAELLTEASAEAGKQRQANSRLIELGERHLGTPAGLTGSFIAGTVVAWAAPKVNKHISLAGTVASVRSLAGLLGAAQWSDLFTGSLQDHVE